MTARSTSTDVALGCLLTFAGGGLVIGALRAQWMPQEMSPCVEGCLVAGVVGFVLALLHPLGYRRALLVSAPVLVVQGGVCWIADAGAAGVVGVELLLFGLVGLLKAFVGQHGGARVAARSRVSGIAALRERMPAAEGHAVMR